MAPERKGARPGQSAPDFTAVDTALKPVRLSAVARHAHLRHRDAALQPGGGQARLGRGGLDDQPRPAVRATLSDFRERAFGPAYGVEIKDGPIAGLVARAVFVVGKDGTRRHVEYVKEIAAEPDYDATLAAAKAAAG